MQFEMGFSPHTWRLIRDFANKVKGIPNAILRGAKRAARELETQTKENITNDILKVRSGSLRRSVSGDAYLEGVGVTISVGSLKGPASRYSRALEEGRRIVPVRATWLTIPVGPALTPAGVAKYASPRDVPVSLKPIISKDKQSGVLISVPSKGSKKDGVVWFVLSKGIDIPKTQWLSKSVRQGENLIALYIDNSVRQFLTGQAA